MAEEIIVTARVSNSKITIEHTLRKSENKEDVIKSLKERLFKVGGVYKVTVTVNKR